MLSASLMIAAVAVAQAAAPATEAFRFDYLRVKDRIDADGHGRRTIEVSVLLRTPTAVQQFGQIGGPYVDGYGDLTFENVRVQKPSGATSEIEDGKIEDLNPFGINDSSIPVDIRIKKLTIPRLEPGDRLSYTTVSTLKPFVPGEAYGEMKFTPVPVDGPQVYELDIPADSRLSVSLRADLGASWEVLPGPADRLIRRLSATVPVTVIASTGFTEGQLNSLQTPDVSFTTFTSWPKVGEWWWNMSRDRVRGDAATKREAEGLVAGKKTAREKIEAIAAFVSGRVRYLNVGFGIGRMQPRSAGSVLSSRYGDCKDKVGLVMALADAVGIEVRPVLIHSARTNLQDEAPGPHQFDHMIAVAILGPTEKDWLWIDPTNALSPPTALPPGLRDKRVLVVNPQGEATMTRTPAALSAAARRTVELTGSIDAVGLFKGLVRATDRSDGEAALRVSFGAVAPEQHAEMLKGWLGSSWSAARITRVSAADPVDVDAPFWIEFDFERDVTGVDSEKEWKFWIPDLGPVFTEASKDLTAKAPLRFDVVESSFRASVEIPEAVTARAPLSISLTRPFASLTSTYSTEGRLLKAERRALLLQPSIDREQLPAYEAFRKASESDRAQDFSIGPIKAAAPGAAALQKEGKAAYARKEYPKAIEIFQQAIAADSSLTGVHFDLGLALRHAKKFEDALTAFTKGIGADPYHDTAYAERAYALFELGRDDEAEEDLLKQIEVAPFKEWSYGRLAQLRESQLRYLEAADLYMKALAIDGSDVDHWLDAGWNFARGGKPEDARRAYEKARGLGLKAGQGVWAAFGYRGMGDFKTAGDLAQEDLAEVSKNVSLITPQNMSSSYLYWVRRLAQAWMIIGEAAREAGELPKAEKFLKAAWEYGFLPDAGFALGLIREQQGKAASAGELWSATATLGNWETRPPDLEARTAKARTQNAINDGSQEMSRLRFINVPGGSPVDVEAEALILVFDGKVTGAINSSKTNEAEVAPVLTRLIGQPFSVPSPDDTPQTLLRAGTLACVKGSGCQFISKIVSAVSGDAIDFGEIQIVSMSPADQSVIRAGETVRLILKLSYDLKGTLPGDIALVVNTAPTELLISPSPTRSVRPGKGTVDFDVTFTVPKSAKELRIFLPLSVKKGATRSVAGAQFVVKP